MSIFEKLIELKLKREWWNHEIYAKIKNDLTMRVWNGNHYPSVSDNISVHTCSAGTKVRVWMVSGHGDVGVTDNLSNPKGYDVRGLDADEDLYDYQIIRKSEK